MSGVKGRSGRKPASLADKCPGPRVDQASRLSWAVIDATLASAQKRLESGEILPSRVLDLARWAVEMKEGKATVRLDSQSQVTVKHDPSLMIQALKELQATESQWRLADIKPIEAPEREPSDPTRDVSHDPVSEVDITE